MSAGNVRVTGFFVSAGKVRATGCGAIHSCATAAASPAKGSCSALKTSLLLLAHIATAVAPAATKCPTSGPTSSASSTAPSQGGQSPFGSSSLIGLLSIEAYGDWLFRPSIITSLTSSVPSTLLENTGSIC